MGDDWDHLLGVAARTKSQFEHTAHWVIHTAAMIHTERNGSRTSYVRSLPPSSPAPPSRCVPPIPLFLLRPRTPLPWINHLILPFCFINLLGVVFGECQEVTEEPSIGVDFQSFGSGVFARPLVDVHVVWVFVFPRSR